MHIYNFTKKKKKQFITEETTNKYTIPYSIIMYYYILYAHKLIERMKKKIDLHPKMECNLSKSSERRNPDNHFLYQDFLCNGFTPNIHPI